MTTETNKVLSHFSATPEIPAFALECANDAVYIYDDNRRRNLLDDPLDTAQQIWQNYFKSIL